MQPAPDEWSDADFRPPRESEFATIQDLLSAIHDRLAGGEAPVEELRLFVLTRLYQGCTAGQVEDELIGWGLEAGYVVRLVSSTQTVGNFGVVEVSTELRFNGMSVGVWRNPTFEGMRQLAARVARLDQEARRLAYGDAPPPKPTPADLGFEPEGLPSRPAPGGRPAEPSFHGRLLVVALLALGLAVGLIVVGAGR